MEELYYYILLNTPINFRNAYTVCCSHAILSPMPYYHDWTHLVWSFFSFRSPSFLLHIYFYCGTQVCPLFIIQFNSYQLIDKMTEVWGRSMAIKHFYRNTTRHPTPQFIPNNVIVKLSEHSFLYLILIRQFQHENGPVHISCKHNNLSSKLPWNDNLLIYASFLCCIHITRFTKRGKYMYRSFVSMCFVHYGCICFMISLNPLPHVESACYLTISFDGTLTWTQMNLRW